MFHFIRYSDGDLSFEGFLKQQLESLFHETLHAGRDQDAVPWIQLHHAPECPVAEARPSETQRA